MARVIRDPRAPTRSGGRGGFAGTILGALILRVIETLLLLTKMPEGMRIILFGLIIIVVTTAYVRLTGRD